jgi:hypothetical protein
LRVLRVLRRPPAIGGVLFIFMLALLAFILSTFYEDKNQSSF